MMFTSAVSPKCVIIDDDNAYKFASADPVINGVQMSRGRLPRDYEAQPFGSLPFAEAFNIPLIPRSEWAARIEEQEKTGTHLEAICRKAGMDVLDQNGTSYCWINAPTWCVMVQRLAHGLPLKRLSPASVGAPIKGYRNQGGWGTEGLEYIVEHGVCSQDVWPPNAIARQYDNAESQQNRKRYRVREWWDLRRSFDELMTCVLLNIPVAIGLNWWSHEVTAMRGVVLGSNSFGMKIANSWGTGWSEDGYGILTESKATPDDAVGPRTVTPSEE